MFKKFSMNTGIVIEHICPQNQKEDFEMICNVIENKHCVMALTDRYGLFRVFNHKIFGNISLNKHMPLHMIVIYGFDKKIINCLFVNLQQQIQNTIYFGLMLMYWLQ